MLTWSTAQTFDTIVLYDRPNANDQITGGNITFSDGTTVSVGSLPNDGSAYTLTFAAKTVTSLQLNITSVSSTVGTSASPRYRSTSASTARPPAAAIELGEEDRAVRKDRAVRPGRVGDKRVDGEPWGAVYREADLMTAQLTVLTPADIQRFERDGYVVVRQAFSPADALAMERQWWRQLEGVHGIRRDDRSGWRPIPGDLKAIPGGLADGRFPLGQGRSPRKPQGRAPWRAPRAGPRLAAPSPGCPERSSGSAQLNGFATP